MAEIVVNWFQIMFLFLVRQLYCRRHICIVVVNWFQIMFLFLVRQLTANILWEYIVVNWFQIMFLFLVRQRWELDVRGKDSCELISNYVLIFGSTTKKYIILKGLLLWIDFKLCSYFWFDNSYWFYSGLEMVVNWFQIMFLFLVRQLESADNFRCVCCELISNYVLIFGSTTNPFLFKKVGVLWIDFKLCSYFWFDNHAKEILFNMLVVNWFQIMFLFLVRQHLNWAQLIMIRCELISNYVLIFGSTTHQQPLKHKFLLWIDFKLCSYFWFDNQLLFSNRRLSVVNWFQIMFLFLVRQLLMGMSLLGQRCELISNYVLIFGSTTDFFYSTWGHVLWIDFKLCSYFWFDNMWFDKDGHHVVVNWFQIMFLFLVRQLFTLDLWSVDSCELISNYVLIFGSTTIFISSRWLG